MTQQQIEELIAPILNRQESINSYVIKKLCKRIQEIGQASPSDLHRLEILYQNSVDIRDINNEILKITGIQLVQLKKLLSIVAEDAYIMAKPYYDYRRKPFIPFKNNKPLQHIVKAMFKQTSGTFTNLSNSGVFMLRDPRNPSKLIPTPLSKAYNQVIDTAVQAVQQGAIDYNTAIRGSIKQLVNSGIKVPVIDSTNITQNKLKYVTERGKPLYRRLDSVVRTNILDAVRDLNIRVQDEIGKQYGSDGKEITVHQYPAPDHAPIQGKQFTNENYERLNNDQPFEDVDGIRYEAIKRNIGQWNCRHFAYSIIIGVTKPNYTKEQLANIQKKNDIGYTLPNGKHFTMYECTQLQRQYELDIRKNKDGQIAARAAGDTDLAKEYQANINRLQNEYRAFSNACGLEMLSGKTTVSGYRKISVK